MHDAHEAKLRADVEVAKQRLAIAVLGKADCARVRGRMRLADIEEQLRNHLATRRRVAGGEPLRALENLLAARIGSAGNVLPVGMQPLEAIAPSF